MTPEEREAISQRAFETLAIFYPHEAAAHDWKRFATFMRKYTGMALTDAAIAEALAGTLDADERAKQDAEPQRPA